MIVDAAGNRYVPPTPPNQPNPPSSGFQPNDPQGGGSGTGTSGGGGQGYQTATTNGSGAGIGFAGVNAVNYAIVLQAQARFEEEQQKKKEADAAAETEKRRQALQQDLGSYNDAENQFATKWVNDNGYKYSTPDDLQNAFKQAWQDDANGKTLWAKVQSDAGAYDQAVQYQLRLAAGHSPAALNAAISDIKAGNNSGGPADQMLNDIVDADGTKIAAESPALRQAELDVSAKESAYARAKDPQAKAKARNELSNALRKVLAIRIAEGGVKDAQNQVNQVDGAGQMAPGWRRVGLAKAEAALSDAESQYQDALAGNIDLGNYTPEQINAALQGLMDDHPELSDPANSDLLQSVGDWLQAGQMVAYAKQAELTGRPQAAMQLLVAAWPTADDATKQLVLADGYTKALAQSIVKEAQKRADANPNSPDGLTYLSDVVKDTPPDLAAFIVRQAEPFITDQIRHWPPPANSGYASSQKNSARSPQDQKVYLSDLAQIVSATQGSGDSKLKTDIARAVAQHFTAWGYDGEAVKSVVGDGADPSLFLEVARQLPKAVSFFSPTANKFALTSDAVQQDVIDGIKLFEDKFKGQLDAISQPLGPLTYYSTQFSSLVAAHPSEFAQYVQRYFHDNPKAVTDLQNNVQEVNASSVQVVNMLNAYSQYAGDLRGRKDWADVSDNILGFIADDRVSTWVSQSPLALQRITDTPGGIAQWIINFARPPAWISSNTTLITRSRLSFARIGTAVSKRFMFKALMAATAGEKADAYQRLNQAVSWGKGVLGGSPSIINSRKAEVRTLLTNIANSKDDVARKDAEAAFLKDEKFRLMWYGDNWLGFGVRGLGAVGTVFGMWSEAYGNDPVWLKWFNEGASFASLAQQVTLLTMMRTGAEWGDAAKFKVFPPVGGVIGMRYIDTVGDRLVFLFALSDLFSAIFGKNDPWKTRFLVTSSVAQFISFAGPLSGLDTIGTIATGVGAALMTVATIGLMADAVVQTQQQAHQYETKATKDFLLAMGVKQKDVSELMQESDNGVTAGPALTLIADYLGFDLSNNHGVSNNPADVQTFVTWVNNLTPPQLATMRRGIDELLAQYSGGNVPDNDQSAANAGNITIYGNFQPAKLPANARFIPQTPAVTGAGKISTSSDYAIAEYVKIGGRVYRRSIADNEMFAVDSSDPYAAFLLKSAPDGADGATIIVAASAPLSKQGLVNWLQAAGIPLPQYKDDDHVRHVRTPW
jgi:hypothetical protein